MPDVAVFHPQVVHFAIASEARSTLLALQSEFPDNQGLKRRLEELGQ